MTAPRPPPEPSKENGFYQDHVALLFSSFARWTGRSLLPVTRDNNVELARLVYHAPYAILSHGTESDPIFNYGNKTAQRLFALTWDELVRLPSRLSAEPVAQLERERLLERVRRFGYVDDYSGIRIASNGQRFTVRNVIVWNLINDHRTYLGQAAYFVDYSSNSCQR